MSFNFSAVFGFFETGDFDVTIPVKGEIQKVILKTKRMETSIWTADTGEAAATERCGVYLVNTFGTPYREYCCHVFRYLGRK